MENHNQIHKKQCKRYDVNGHAHYLTFSCFHGQAFLSGNHAPGWLVESIEAARQSVPFDLWAYVFMPDHVHMLVRPNQGITISDILKAIKQPAAVRAVRHVKVHAPEVLTRMKDVQPNGRYSYRFWQRGGGYDRNIWSIEDIRTKINYIHDNPVRRGLVDSPGEWTWSSYNAWEKEVDVPLEINRNSLGNA